MTISDGILDRELAQAMIGQNVLIVDDSSTARNQVRDTLSQLGLNIIECRDGLEALTVLKRWCDEGKDIEKNC